MLQYALGIESLRWAVGEVLGKSLGPVEALSVSGRP